ncbi:MAG TPA: hypothetical protein DDW16_00145 [Clostridiales bacterium]|nr:hypothetical protein [Clostridiales bacterium]
MKNTNEKIERIKQFLTLYVAENGFPPSVREICSELGFKSTSTAQYYLDKMQDLGLLKKSCEKKRTLTLPVSENTISYRNVPLVGTVTAGIPITAVENLEGYYPIPDEFSSDSELFLLKVRGFSMKDAGILDGDKIIVKKQSTADNGDIVVAYFDDSATVKRFFKRNEKFILHPENPEFSDIILDEVSILGKVCGLYRKM